MRRENEVDRSVGERQLVARRNDVDGPFAAAETPFILLVGRVHVGEAIDVEGVEAEVVMRRAPDLDPAQSVQIAVDEVRPMLRAPPENPPGVRGMLACPIADRFPDAL